MRAWQKMEACAVGLSSPALALCEMQNSDGLELIQQFKGVTENLGRAYDQSKTISAICIFHS